ncbi:GNAT family N-acetyltransferase [Streptomyces sp. A7024]|uniref:GNAT family N-acetyltransferase n=1 Tax=Streptomyces coryli TaxID=1128680 RepID=A0A6G4TRW9_9ACTN|nr:GNAT family N-acetyltransferase [Streptomyces coryli]NGN62300.1 GNAT family N-acetyltransferase [Streptomyces coryli]
MAATVRPLVADDAAQLLDLQLALDAESAFMLLEPGERDDRPPEIPPPGASYLLGAFEGERLIGYVDVSVLPYARARRTGHVVMGVRAGSAGRGVGRALLTAAAETGRGCGLRRLELTVMEHNRNAIALYLRCGFQFEGRRRSALDVDGAAVSEYYMGLLLD